jgi:hypothetical protein
MMGSVGGAVADPAQQIIVRSWQKSDVFNRGAKIRTNTFTSYQPLGIVLGDDKRFAGNAGLVVAEHKVSTYTYEQNSPIAGKSDSDKCAQGNQGRLLSIFAETYQPRGVALKDVLATYPQGDDQIALQGDKLELMKAEVSLTSYVYDLGRVSQVGSGDGWQTETLGDGPRITTITYRPVGAIIPDEYAYKSTGTPDPMPLAIASNKSQTWQELRFGEWSEDTVEFQALALVDSTGADRLRTVYKDRPDDLRMLLLSLRQSSGEETISNSGQANPPAADTYPPAKTSKQTSVEGKAVLPSNSADSLKPKEQTLGFDYIAATASTEAGAKAAATAEAARLAGIWGPVLWGKHKTCSYSTDFNDGWRSYKPMSRIDVTEPEATFSYLGNAFAIAIAGNRCAISFDGILLGKTAVVPPGVAAPDVFPPVDVVPPYKVVAIGNAAVGASASGVAQTYATTLLVAVGNAAVGASGFARGLTTYIGRMRSGGVVVPRQRVIVRVQSAGNTSAVSRPAPVVSRMASRGVAVPRSTATGRTRANGVIVPRDLEIIRGQMQGASSAVNVPPAIVSRMASRGVVVPGSAATGRTRTSGNASTPGYSASTVGLSGTSGLTQLFSGSGVDESNTQLPNIGFDFPLYGTNYRTDIYVNSNAFVTFGYSVIKDSGFSITSPGRALLVAPQDRCYNEVWGGASGRGYRFVWIGSRSFSPVTGAERFEVTLFPDGAIMLVFGTSTFNNSAIYTLTSGVTLNTPYTWAQNTSFVWTPDGSGSYIVRTGSYT